MTVDEMRKALSSEATETIFEGYKQQYDAIRSEYQITVTELKKLSSEHKAFKKALRKNK